MKALTIREPWATLIVRGVKRIETRPKPTKYRGRLAIHAGQRMGRIDGGPAREARIRELLDEVDRARDFKARTTFLLRPGHVLGSVDVVDCVRAEEIVESLSARDRLLGDFSPGRWAWILRNPEVLAEPVPAKGALAFWEWQP